MDVVTNSFSIYTQNPYLNGATKGNVEPLEDVEKKWIEQALSDVKENKLDLFHAENDLKSNGVDVSTPKGQQALIEIAKIAAQRSGSETSFQIKNCGIDASTPEGQQGLIEIAELSAQQSGWEISQYIKNFRIDASSQKGQEALIRIAKRVAKQDGFGISLHITNFQIDTSASRGREALIEIAKLAAQQNGWGTSQYIKNYDIDASTPEGQQALIEIAKLAAQQDGKGTSQYIKNYGIDASTHEGQRALIEIAKLAAQQDGSGTSEYIKKYQINGSTREGQQALIEIVKLAAQEDCLRTLVYFRNYEIDLNNSEVLQVFMEIVKQTAQIAAPDALECFSNYLFLFSSSEKREKVIDLLNFIFNCYVIQLPSIESRYLNEISGRFNLWIEGFTIPFQENFELFRNLYTNDSNSVLVKSICLCAKLFDMSQQDLEWIKTTVDAAEGEKEKIEVLDWFMNTTVLCASHVGCKNLIKGRPSLIALLSVLPIELRDLLTRELIVAAYQDKGTDNDQLSERMLKEFALIKKITVLPRDLRQSLAKAFVQACQPQYAKVWDNIKKVTEDVTHGALPCLLLSLYPFGDYTSVLRIIKGDRSLRDAKYQQPMLWLLTGIKNSYLTDEMKKEVLQKVFGMPDDKRYRAFRYVIDILNFQGEVYLENIESFHDLPQALEKVFVEKCKIKVDDFNASYESSIGTWRTKEAVTTYAANVARDTIAFPYFQTFLTTVLRGQFIPTRYALDANPHLNEIAANHPEIFEKWKLSTELNLEELGQNAVTNTKTPQQTVVETLKFAVENEHLGGDRQADLFPHLNSCRKNWEQTDMHLKTITEALKPLSDIRPNPEQLEERQRLMLQKSLLEIVTSTEDLDKKLNTLKGWKIKGLDELLSPFYQDLKDVETLLRSPAQPNEQEYRVVDTDDPNHFLLMGTEVLNSCQNVNGSVSLNVGLLGYALDGKHRLALVCDPASGKILARTVLRLLVDTEGKPVLFQERMYVADINPAYADLLRKLARKKADALGVPLVVSSSDFEHETAEKYPLFIEAKDKPVPYEYVDALSGLQKGTYTIQDALLIHKS